MKKTKFIAAALAVLFVFNAYAIPRSKAVVVDATAAFGAAAATAAINGTTATTLFSGMTTSAATSAMTGLMSEYVVATGSASSGTALAASIGAGTVITAAGAIVLTAAAGYAVYKFIEWLREDKGLVPGGASVSFSRANFFLDGSSVDFAYFPGSYSNSYSFLTSKQQEYYFPMTSDEDIHTFSSGGAWKTYKSGSVAFLDYLPAGGSWTSYLYRLNNSYASYSFVFCDSYGSFEGSSSPALVLVYPSVDGSYVSQSAFIPSTVFADSYELFSYEIQPKPEFQPIPNEIPDTDAVVITGIGGLPQNDPQAAADAIFQTAIDGALEPTVSVESDPTVTPDPDPDPDPDPTLPPDDLPPNLPQLGDVLTSRFPFSIPWDIGRVLDFLSAEPVAPHVEFQPFKGDLFGIPAGSVSVDFDFSKYEDIASFCRTFEIVGFCLLLAVGTKRLIWTA